VRITGFLGRSDLSNGAYCPVRRASASMIAGADERGSAVMARPTKRSCILLVWSRLTIEQAFQAMRCFVDQFMKREPEQYRERFEQIIRWTRVEGGAITYDPAQWEDWKASVARALGPESNLP
jgi:hypothetical protein